MHYLSTSAPCDNNSAPFHLSYLLAPTSVIPPPPGGGTAHFRNHCCRLQAATVFVWPVADLAGFTPRRSATIAI